MNDLGLYVLDADNHVVEAEDVYAWAQWFESIENRLVAYTQITSAVQVSTIFLGIDHRYVGNGPPIVFETMIFGGPLDQETWRYASWDDAEAGHATAVAKARAAIGQHVESKA